MRRRLGVAALAAVFIAPTGAHAEPSIREKTVDKFGRKQVQKYAHFHRTWTHRSGKNVVGRQIVKHGMPRKGRDRVASRREWRRTMAVFDRWEHPPTPAPAPVMYGTSPAASSAYNSGTGSYSIPSGIVACEKCTRFGGCRTVKQLPATSASDAKAKTSRPSACVPSQHQPNSVCFLGRPPSQKAEYQSTIGRQFSPYVPAVEGSSLTANTPHTS